MTINAVKTTPRISLLPHSFLTILYDHSRRLPIAVAEQLTAGQLANPSKTSKARLISPHDAIPENQQLGNRDYHALKPYRFSRGHLAARSNYVASVAAQKAVNVYANIVPQCQETNSGTWNHLEMAIRKITPEADDICVLTGAIWDPHKKRIFHKIDIPSSLYKIVKVTTSAGQTQIFSFEVPNHPSSNSQALEAYVTNIGDIQCKVPFPLPLLLAAHNARKRRLHFQE